MSSASVRFPDTHQAKSLTDMLQTKLRSPVTSPEFTSTVLWTRCWRMSD